MKNVKNLVAVNNPVFFEAAPDLSLVLPQYLSVPNHFYQQNSRPTCLMFCS